MDAWICRGLKSPLGAVALAAINIVTAIGVAAAAEPARPQARLLTLSHTGRLKPFISPIGSRLP